MKINVTQQHIDQGKPTSKSHCPIALAVREQFKSLAMVGVGIVSFKEKNDDELYGYKQLPRLAIQFIRDFDMSKPVQPFSFEL